MISFRNLDCVSCSSLQGAGRAEGSAGHAEGSAGHAEGSAGHTEGSAGHAEGSAGHAEGPANPAEVGDVMLLGAPELGGPWKYKFVRKEGRFTFTPALTSYPVTRAVAISSNLIHPTRGA